MISTLVLLSVIAGACVSVTENGTFFKQETVTVEQQENNTLIIGDKSHDVTILYPIAVHSKKECPIELLKACYYWSKVVPVTFYIEFGTNRRNGISLVRGTPNDPRRLGYYHYGKKWLYLSDLVTDSDERYFVLVHELGHALWAPHLVALGEVKKRGHMFDHILMNDPDTANEYLMYPVDNENYETLKVHPHIINFIRNRLGFGPGKAPVTIQESKRLFEATKKAELLDWLNKK